jgi:hypothetical protein
MLRRLFPLGRLKHHVQEYKPAYLDAGRMPGADIRCFANDDIKWSLDRADAIAERRITA